VGYHGGTFRFRARDAGSAYSNRRDDDMARGALRRVQRGSLHALAGVLKTHHQWNAAVADGAEC